MSSYGSLYIIHHLFIDMFSNWYLLSHPKQFKETLNHKGRDFQAHFQFKAKSWGAFIYVSMFERYVTGTCANVWVFQKAVQQI